MQEELYLLDKFCVAAANRIQSLGAREEVFLEDNATMLSRSRNGSHEDLQLESYVQKIQRLILEQHSEVELLRKLEGLLGSSNDNTVVMDELQRLHQSDQYAMHVLSKHTGPAEAQKHREAIEFFTKLIEGVKLQAEIDLMLKPTA